MGAHELRHPVAKAVLVAVLAMITIPLLSGFVVGAFSFPGNSPYVVASVSLLVPIVIGACWFRLMINRVMAHQERLVFATSIALVNTALVIGISYATTGSGVSFSATKLLAEMALLVFAGAYLLGWLLTLRVSRLAD